MLRLNIPGVGRVAGFLVLAGVVIAVYWPSFYHVARGDQIQYLAEMSTRHGFMDTVFGAFDINRTRIFCAGDEVAFRPLLYIMLGLERFLFGHDFFWWQVVGVVVHLFVLGAFYALLCRISGGVFAFVMVAFFAFLPINVEAVIWHHISAYLVFAGCVLMALKGLYRMEEEGGCAEAHGVRVLGWMVPAVFLYEAGVWYLAVLAAFFAFRREWPLVRWAGVLLAFYLVLDIASYLVRHPGVSPGSGFVDAGQAFLRTPVNVALAAKWFLSSAFFLDVSDLIPISRMMVREHVVSWAWPLGQPWNGGIIGGSVLLGCFLIWAVACRFFAEGVRRNVSLIVVCAAMAAGYLALIAVGRINGLGAWGFCVALYYSYNFLVLSAVILALASARSAGMQVGGKRFLMPFLLAMVMLCTAYNAWGVARLTRSIARDSMICRMFLSDLDGFVRAHQHEPGFSFYVGPRHPGNYVADWVMRRGDPPGTKYTVAHALYPQYFNDKDPRYRIVGP